VPLTWFLQIYLDSVAMHVAPELSQYYCPFVDRLLCCKTLMCGLY
jgi:hypothetical protein